MTIQGVMSSARARQFRWALLCALIALAGGSPSARAGYAEVAGAAAVLGAPSHRHATGEAPLAERASRPLATAAVAVTRARATHRTTSPLYLAHCALLL